MSHRNPTLPWLAAAVLLALVPSCPAAAAAQTPPAAVAELERAARALAGEAPAAAARAWRAVVEAAPDHGEGWYRLGYALHMAGDYEAALVAHRRAAALAFSPAAAFHVACALARLGRSDEAIAALDDAIAAGFTDAEHTARDQDLASLRDDARFAAVLGRMRAAAKARQEARIQVAVLVFPGVELLDFAGPLETFAAARADDGAAFHAFTVARSKQPLRTHGTHVVAQYDFADCPQPRIVVIPGGNVREVTEDAATMAWLAEVRPGLDLLMSVCNGAFALARLDALDGRHVITHHSAVQRLAQEVPGATLVPGARFVDSGDLLTAAGVSAGIDGALHVVERYCGRDAAWRTARYMEYEWRPDRIGPYGIGDPDKAAARAAIATAVGHYLDGVLRGRGAEHVDHSLHPSLAKLGIAPGRGEGGADAEYPRSFADMRKVAARGTDHANADAEARFELLDLHDAIAVVKLQAPWGIDYLTLARVDGDWRVRHILWQWHPRDGK